VAWARGSASHHDAKQSAPSRGPYPGVRRARRSSIRRRPRPGTGKVANPPRCRSGPMPPCTGCPASSGSAAAAHGDSATSSASGAAAAVSRRRADRPIRGPVRDRIGDARARRPATRRSPSRRSRRSTHGHETLGRHPRGSRGRRSVRSRRSPLRRSHHLRGRRRRACLRRLRRRGTIGQAVDGSPRRCACAARCPAPVPAARRTDAPAARDGRGQTPPDYLPPIAVTPARRSSSSSPASSGANSRAALSACMASSPWPEAINVRT
jgi:hypothetical protein